MLIDRYFFEDLLFILTLEKTLNQDFQFLHANEFSNYAFKIKYVYSEVFWNANHTMYKIEW